MDYDGSGYSWTYYAPLVVVLAAEDPKPLASASKFCVHTTGTEGCGSRYVSGYVQFYLPMTIAVLQKEWPNYKWFKSVNDPRIYGTLMARTPPHDMVITGTPRPKLDMKVCRQLGRVIKKKVKDALTINIHEEAVKASLAFLRATSDV